MVGCGIIKHMIQLSEKQRQTLEVIAQFIGQEGGRAPTFAELRAALNISSNQTLIDRLDSLAKKELVVRNPKQHRSISFGPKAMEFFASGISVALVSSLENNTSATFGGAASGGYGSSSDIYSESTTFRGSVIK